MKNKCPWYQGLPLCHREKEALQTEAQTEMGHANQDTDSDTSSDKTRHTAARTDRLCIYGSPGADTLTLTMMDATTRPWAVRGAANDASDSDRHQYR